MSCTIIFVAPRFPNIVSSFLTKKGYLVVEARSNEEIEQLSSGRVIDAVILAAESRYLHQSIDRETTISVEFSIHASSRELFVELARLLPQSTIKVQ